MKRHSTSFSQEEALVVEAVLSRVINNTDPMQRNTSPALATAYRKFLRMTRKSTLLLDGIARANNGTAEGHE